ncbi:MAG: hypothetical protein WC916_02950 [Candidatus Woesearchaeota archaeon]
MFGKSGKLKIGQLILVILVVITFFLLVWGGYSLLSRISPFSKEINFVTTIVIVIGFYVGGGFAFKKLKII